MAILQDGKWIKDTPLEPKIEQTKKHILQQL